jgi:hypothetical protein
MKASALKKSLCASEQDRPDVARRRTRWKQHQDKLDPARVVFIDETWAKTNMTRTHGRCARGVSQRSAAFRRRSIRTIRNGWQVLRYCAVRIVRRRRPPSARSWSFRSPRTRLRGPSGRSCQQPSDTHDSIFIQRNPGSAAVAEPQRHLRSYPSDRRFCAGRMKRALIPIFG